MASKNLLPAMMPSIALESKHATRRWYARLGSLLACVLSPCLGHAQTAELPTPDNFRAGDAWEWRQVDTRTKQVETKLVRSVVAVNAGVLQFFDGVARSDIASDLTFGSRGEETRKPWRAWPLSLGKKWVYDGTWRRSDGVTGTTQQDVEVVAYEEVAVPAGKFMAFKIEHRGFYRNSNGATGKQQDTYWYAPEAKCDVKHDRFDGFNSYSQELTSFRLASASAGETGLLSTPPTTPGSRLFLDESALRARLVGKTVHLKRYADGAIRELSFRQDGSASMEGGGRKGRSRNGTWEFSGGKMCAHLGPDDSCFLFFEEAGVLKVGPRDEDPRWEVLQIQ